MRKTFALLCISSCLAAGCAKHEPQWLSAEAEACRARIAAFRANVGLNDTKLFRERKEIGEQTLSLTNAQERVMLFRELVKEFYKMDVQNLPGCDVVEKNAMGIPTPVHRVCRLLIGMNRPHSDIIQEMYGLDRQKVDSETAQRWRKRVAAFLAERGDWAGSAAAAEDGLRRSPGWNALQIAYARALNGCGRWRDTVRFLEGVEVLPSEFGDNACDLWQEAWKNLGDEKTAATCPENLGKGAPYPPTAR